MVFDIELVPGASLKSPADRTFDLEFADGTLVVTYGGTDYTYVVKQTGYTDPLLSRDGRTRREVSARCPNISRSIRPRS